MLLRGNACDLNCVRIENKTWYSYGIGHFEMSFCVTDPTDVVVVLEVLDLLSSGGCAKGVLSFKSSLLEHEHCRQRC